MPLHYIRRQNAKLIKFRKWFKNGKILPRYFLSFCKFCLFSLENYIKSFLRDLVFFCGVVDTHFSYSFGHFSVVGCYTSSYNPSCSSTWVVTYPLEFNSSWNNSNYVVKPLPLVSNEVFGHITAHLFWFFWIVLYIFLTCLLFLKSCSSSNMTVTVVVCYIIITDK